jgi:hypothetical protein
LIELAIEKDETKRPAKGAMNNVLSFFSPAVQSNMPRTSLLISNEQRFTPFKVFK